MPHVAVTAIGSDQPGIVAAVTGVLVDRGCNLEDTSMSILRGHFAMMLVVQTPPGLDAGELESALAAAVGSLELTVTVRAIDDGVPVSPTGAPWTVSLYGADRPGLVHRTASLLAGMGVNIVDMTTRVIGDADRPVYAMFVDVTLPAGVVADDVSDALSRLAAEVGVSCSMHAADADVL